MTDKEEAFVNAYLSNGFNQMMAAASAGYSDPQRQAWVVRHQADVAAEIDRRMTEFGMGANEVLARISSHARADMTDFIDDSGTGLDLRKAKDAYKLGLIKSYSYSRKTGLKIELWDAQSALRDMGRHHKLFTERHEFNFNNLSDADLLASIQSEIGGSEAPGIDAEPGES